MHTDCLTSPPAGAAEAIDYRQFFDLNPWPLLIFDETTHRILDVNRAAIAMYGYERLEFLRLSILEVCPKAPATVSAETHYAKDGATLQLEVARTAVTWQARPAVLITARPFETHETWKLCLALRESVTSLSAGNGLDVTGAVVERLATALACEAAEVWRLDPDSGWITVTDIWKRAEGGSQEPLLQSSQWTPPGEPRWFPQLVAHPRARVLPAWQPESYAAVAIPLRTKSAVVGEMLLIQRNGPAPPELVMRTLGEIGCQLGEYLENRRIQRELREMETHYRTLFEEAPIPYHEIDHEGRIVSVNRAECNMLGFREEQMVGRFIWDFVSPHQREASRDSVREKLRTGRIRRTFERTFQRSDGHELLFELHERVIRNGANQVTGIRTTMVDITSMRIAQRQVSFQAELLDRIGEAVIACDSSGRITSWNRAAEELFGWTRSQTLGRPVADLGLFDEAAVSRIGNLTTAGVGWAGELACTTSEGSTLPVDAAWRHFGENGDTSVGSVGVHRDASYRKATEEKLRILFRAVEQSPISIVITDPGGIIEYVNPKTCEVTQYTREELIGQKPSVLKSGHTTPEEYRQLWQVITHGEWRGIFQNRKKNGEFYWEAATIGAVRDDSGSITHYFAVKEDITERREMQLALQQATERFRVAAENSADLIFEWDEQTDRTQIIGGSQELGSEMRRTAAGNLAEFFSMTHPQDRDRTLKEITGIIQRGERLRHECRIVLPSGVVQHISIRATPVEDGGGGRKWIGVVQDVTTARASERANAELAAIVESNEAAIVSKDLNGIVLTWNPGAERIYGYTAAEMIGKDIGLLWPSVEGHAEIIRENIRQGKQVVHLETMLITKAGTPINVLLTVSPIRDARGQVIGAAHVAWDITERKRLEQQLAHGQKMESIGQLAAGVAHEINTPIQYISDNTEFLGGAFAGLLSCLPPGASSDPSVDLEYLREEVPAAIGQMHQGIAHVTRIVRAMKEFSHPGTARKIPSDINHAIESTIAVSRNEWKYVAEMETELDPALPLVPCLTGEFNQVMLNLILNAAHAVEDVNRPAGGKGVIRVSTRREGSFAQVRVRDSGIGIPPEIQSKIFDPFFTTKPVGKGTGQGLAIAYAVVVQKHGGSISFETKPGVGTTFIVQLPLHTSEGSNEESDLF